MSDRSKIRTYPPSALKGAAYTAFVSSSISRRLFLAASAAALNLPAAVQPNFQFPTEPRRRLSVSTYPFRNVIGKAGKMTLPEFAATVVDKFEVYGIEPWSSHFTSIEPAYVHSLREAFDKAKLQVVNIPCDVNVKACGASAQRTAAQLAWRKWVDVAVILNSPSIRVHVSPGNDLHCAKDSLNRIADYSAGKNIVINLENDDPRTENPFQLQRLLSSMRNPWVRSLPDFCNSMQIQNDENYNATALAGLFPLAYNISHVKDVEVVGGKALTVDVDRIFGIAKNTGYRGFFSMETEGTLDPYVGSRKLIASALKSLSS